MGKRLGEYTRNNTKCMVPVNGVPLIDRLLRQLSEIHLNRIIIVVGYEGQKLIDYIGEKHTSLNIEFVFNHVYDKTNNIYSLALAKEKMIEDDTILVESDLIFEDGMFDLLVNDPFPNLALVAKYETWMDGTMVRIDESNNIINFVPKSTFNYNDTPYYYKTVNIYKLSKEFAATKYIPFMEAYLIAVGNNEYYENVLRVLSFLNPGELKALPITNEKWYEIDDKQDLDIAEVLFADEDQLLKKYHSRYGGFWRFPQLLDFCYLVNPYFRKSKIIDELEANFPTLIAEYPSGMRVNSLLASKCWGVSEEYIVPGNGAAELIKVLMESIDGKVGVTRPTFEEYPNRLEADRIEAFVPTDETFRYTADDLTDHFTLHPINTLLLINPDNPSGNFIPFADILRLASWCEKNDVRLVVDESFVDFSRDWETSSLLSNSILESYPHLVVMKSISKSYGVPGLRLGIMASADKELIAKAKREVSIWNINSFAEFFMQIFSKYEKDYKAACQSFIQTRDEFESKLRDIPFLKVMPSQANYFFCEVTGKYTATGLAIRLLKDHNILLSACGAKKGITPNKYVRIAVRDREDNDRLIAAMKEL